MRTCGTSRRARSVQSRSSGTRRPIASDDAPPSFQPLAAARPSPYQVSLIAIVPPPTVRRDREVKLLGPADIQTLTPESALTLWHALTRQHTACYPIPVM